jgi:ribonuclease PH
MFTHESLLTSNVQKKMGDISTQNQKKKERERKKGRKKEIKLWKKLF